MGKHQRKHDPDRGMKNVRRAIEQTNSIDLALVSDWLDEHYTGVVVAEAIRNQETLTEDEVRERVDALYCNDGITSTTHLQRMIVVAAPARKWVAMV